MGDNKQTCKVGLTLAHLKQGHKMMSGYRFLENTKHWYSNFCIVQNNMKAAQKTPSPVFNPMIPMYTSPVFYQRAYMALIYITDIRH
jgi:hypothetical protein